MLVMQKRPSSTRRYIPGGSFEKHVNSVSDLVVASEDVSSANWATALPAVLPAFLLSFASLEAYLYGFHFGAWMTRISYSGPVASPDSTNGIWHWCRGMNGYILMIVVVGEVRSLWLKMLTEVDVIEGQLWLGRSCCYCCCWSTIMKKIST